MIVFHDALVNHTYIALNKEGFVSTDRKHKSPLSEIFRKLTSEIQEPKSLSINQVKTLLSDCKILKERFIEAQKKPMWKYKKWFWNIVTLGISNLNPITRHEMKIDREISNFTEIVQDKLLKEFGEEFSSCAVGIKREQLKVEIKNSFSSFSREKVDKIIEEVSTKKGIDTFSVKQVGSLDFNCVPSLVLRDLKEKYNCSYEVFAEFLPTYSSEKLREIDCSKCNELTSRHLLEMAKSFPRLEKLNLRETNITPSDLVPILRHLPLLKELEIDNPTELFEKEIAMHAVNDVILNGKTIPRSEMEGIYYRYFPPSEYELPLEIKEYLLPIIQKSPRKKLESAEVAYEILLYAKKNPGLPKFFLDEARCVIAGDVRILEKKAHRTEILENKYKDLPLVLGVEGKTRLKLTTLDQSFFDQLPSIGSKNLIELDCLNCEWLKKEHLLELLKSFPFLEKLNIKGTSIDSKDLISLLPELPCLKNIQVDNPSKQLLQKVADHAIFHVTINEKEVLRNEKKGICERFLPKKYLDMSFYSPILQEDQQVKLSEFELRKLQFQDPDLLKLINKIFIKAPHKIQTVEQAFGLLGFDAIYPSLPPYALEEAADLILKEFIKEKKALALIIDKRKRNKQNYSRFISNYSRRISEFANLALQSDAIREILTPMNLSDAILERFIQYRLACEYVVQNCEFNKKFDQLLAD